MSTYPDSVTVVASVTAGDTDIAGDVISNITGSDGKFNNNPVDFVAGIGICKFQLDNSGGLYDPADGSAVAGWGIGTKVVINVVFESVTYPVFTGKVRDLIVDPDPFSEQPVTVTLNDWTEEAGRHFVKAAAITADKKVGESMTTLVGLMPNAPTTSTFSTGTRTFKTVFDDIKPNTKAIAEMRKLSISEWAYMYVKPADELVVEDREDRLGTRAKDQITTTDNTGALLLDDGSSFLLLDDGASKLLLNIDSLNDIPADAHLVDYPKDVRYGKNVLNNVIARAYPRDIGAANEVLYTLGTPVLLPNSQIITIRGSYTDPTGGGPVAGQSMVALVPTTDYLINRDEDGGGSDETGNVNSVTATYYADGFSVAIDVGNTFGFLTKLEPRGIALRKYNVVESELTDSTSQTNYGEFSFTIDQKYQSSNQAGLAEGDAILAREKEPRREIRGLTYSGNVSEVMMRAFLQKGIGDLMRIRDTGLSIDSNFYVMSRRFVIALGGIIIFFWVIKQTFTLIDGGLTEAGMEFTGNNEAASSTGTPQILTFPLNEDFSDNFVTVACRVFLDAADATFTQTIIQLTNIGQGDDWFRVAIQPSRKITVNSAFYNGNDGRYETTTDTISLSTWAYISVSYDFSSVGNVPTVYIDGSSVALTELFASTGTIEPIGDIQVNMGAARNFGGIRVWNGKLQHCRAYNKILDATAHSNLFSNFTDATHNVTGLVMQGPSVYTTEAADLYDTTIGSGAVLENVMGMAGRADIGGSAITIRELAP